MSAQPIEPHAIEHDPDEILGRLPEQYRGRFLADYREAMIAAAHETWRWEHLAKALRTWHLRSLAYSRPGYEQARAEAAAGIGAVAAAEVIPDWAERVSQHASRRPA